MKTQIASRFTLGKLFAVAAACLSIQNIQAQLLFSEGFDYTAGQGLASKINPGNSVAWNGGNTNELQIGSSQLTYSGLQLLPGNELVYTSSGSASSTYNTYSAVTSGSIYFSFLIDCTTLPTANQYIAALNPGTTTPGGSGDAMGTYVGATAGGWKIGVRNGNSGAVYSTTVLSLNTTYFVVEKLTLGSSAVVSLFLDPTPGGSQPGTPDATQNGTVAVSSVADIGFKVQTATTTGNFDIGNLLIAQDWADVTPEAAPEPSSLALAGLGLVGLAAGYRRSRK